MRLRVLAAVCLVLGMCCSCSGTTSRATGAATGGVTGGVTSGATGGATQARTGPSDGAHQVDCGELDTRAVTSTTKQGRVFDAANSCMRRALMTGIRAEFTYDQMVGNGVVVVTYRVDGAGRLDITEDHRADSYARHGWIHRRCTSATSLLDQGTCIRRTDGARPGR